MKYKLLFILLLILWSCKTTSVSKQNLLSENKVLKERLIQLEKIDTSVVEAIVEVNKMNIVYRGVFNPISISVPHAVKIIASASGLKQVDNYGNYSMVPTTGNYVDIKVLGIMPNNDTIIRTKRLRIKDIGKFIGTINGFGCSTKCELLLTKNQLHEGEVKARLYDFLFDWAEEVEITSFKIKLHDHKTIKIEGNKIIGLENKIKNLNTGDRVQIFDIKLRISSRVSVKPPSPILIRIVED